MRAFQIVWVALFITIAAYTAVVVVNHGPNLFPRFFGDILAMSWAGQFNVDFMSFLVLSALWLAWRHHFSPTGLVLAVLGFFGGGLFLCAYLLVVSLDAGGDPKVLLLGRQRAA
ncbi:MAG: hypothetical protein O2780_05725 [Proteobacteria bacterium]|nr:hypothetical protein [Pseudomonadota bacterium]MDA1300187.1 hypothetical protein [Pseudomonadota bacterium]